MVERVCGSGLDGDRSTISHVRANRIQCVDEAATADGKPDSRACHVEGLREGVELDGYVLRARDLKRAGCNDSVVCELAVRQIRQEEDSVPPTKCHGLDV